MLRGVSFRAAGVCQQSDTAYRPAHPAGARAFSFALYHLIGQPTVDRLARAQMELAAEQLEARFGSLLKTVEVTLRSSQGWASMAISTTTSCCVSTSSSSHHRQPRRNHVGHFAHESGREILLLMDEQGAGSTAFPTPQPGVGKPTGLPGTPTGRSPAWRCTSATTTPGNARGSGCHGAARRPDGVLTEPYIFLHNQGTGHHGGHALAGSRWFQLCDRPRCPPPRHRRIHHPHGLQPAGKAALFLREGRLIAPPRDPRFTDRQAIGETLLKTPEELICANWPRPSGMAVNPEPDMACIATARMTPSGSACSGRSRTTPVASGWASRRRKAISRADSSQDVLLLGLIMLSALALGMIVAIRIAKRFGEPLQALAEESARIGAQHLESPVICDAPGEVRQLATALDTMREHLCCRRAAISCKPTSIWK